MDKTARGGYFLIDNDFILLFKEKLNSNLIDYKFYCFGGEPKFLYVADSNFIDGEKHDLLAYLDLNWMPTPFDRPDHPKLLWKVPKPDKLPKMIELARTLSLGLPFLRTDFYYVNGKVLFSELTFCPGSGFGAFSPKEWERKIGDWILLPNKDMKMARG